MNRKEHWEQVYRTRRSTEVSWYQAEARLSASLIQRLVPNRDAAIIDVGGGASVLAPQLIHAGYLNLTVLDLSATALASARAELGGPPSSIRWIEADVLDVALPAGGYDFWHDRAVFHFLTDASDRAKYVAQARRAVRAGGHVLVATFAEDGPTRCSGLEVMRYSPAELHAAFGPGFRYITATREQHRTPAGTEQAFTYCLCEREEPSLQAT